MSSKLKKSAKIFQDLTPFQNTKAPRDLQKCNLRQLLTSRQGIGHPMAKKIMEHSGYHFDFPRKFEDMRVTFITRRMNQFFEQYDRFFDEKLRNKVREDVRKFIRIGSRRGMQHRDKLPTNGQHSKRANMRRRFKYY